MKKNSANLFVVAAPSGAGKTTIVKKLVERNPEIRFPISYTTRRQRHTEVPGVDYFFVDIDEVNRLNERGELLEFAQVFDNYYATSRGQVEEHLADGRNVVLEIDWQGAQQVRESMPECVTIFILPPSLDELERRLRDRRTDTPEVIERRLRDALSDMSHWDEFDYVIINDKLEQAVDDLEKVLAGDGESCSRKNVALRRVVSRIVG